MAFEIVNKDWDFFAAEQEELQFEKEATDVVVEDSLTDVVSNPQVRSIFREYDLRGHMDLFDDSVVRAIAGAMTVLIDKLGSRSNGKVIIGSDNEDYNVKSKEVAQEIFLEAGMTVYDVGVTSTPAIYFAQQHYGCDAICAFTASHNPYGDKGMKAGVTGYATFGPAGMQVLYEQFQRAERIKRQRGEFRPIDHGELFTAYADMIADKGIEVEQGQYVVINTLNATGGEVVKQVLESFGLNVVGINLEQKPSQEGDPQKNPELEDVKEETRRKLNEEIKRLAAEGVETKKIFALAFDRDADRMVPVGQHVTYSADELAVLALRQKARNIASLEGCSEMLAVADLKTSMAVFEDYYCQEAGLRILPWYTGHSYIKQYMRYLIQQGHRVIGGAEKSGHLFQEGCYDEPLESALLLLQYLMRNKLSLEEAQQTIAPYELGPSTKAALDPEQFSPRGEESLKDRKYEIMQQVIGILYGYVGHPIANGRFTCDEVIDLGYNSRAFFSSSQIKGNFVLRPSSNEEVLTINIEARKDGSDTSTVVGAIENFIAFDVLAAHFSEFSTVAAHLKNSVNSEEAQREYLSNSEQWSQDGEGFSHRESGSRLTL